MIGRWPLLPALVAIYGCAADQAEPTAPMAPDITPVEDAIPDARAAAEEATPPTDPRVAESDASLDTTHTARSVAGPQCGGLGPGVEDCHFRLVWSNAKCGRSCDRLLIYWAGGEQSCNTGKYDPLLRRYADEGFVAACAQPFSSSDEAGRYPYVAEAQRMSHLVQASWLLGSSARHAALR